MASRLLGFLPLSVFIFPSTPSSLVLGLWLRTFFRMTFLPATKISHEIKLLTISSRYLPQHLHYVTIPVHKNATLLSPDAVSGQSRWPTVVFSHGLGGSRNAYSHLAGSLASHGIVVICPEHRDGSSIVSLARSTESTLFLKYPSRVFPCIRIPHTNTPEVWAARDKQMRIRLWELGLNLEAVLAIDNASFHVLKYNMNESTPESAVSQFSGKLDVQEPGKIVFGGHSFGAATMVQLLKCTYYAGKPELSEMPTPLFTPSKDSAIRRQITEQTPTFLLDMWCFQLLSAATEPLFNLPLPAYDDVPSAPGGNAILAIESDGFYKWKDHLHSTARILSPDPTQKVVSAESFTPTTLTTVNKPHFFYVRDSVHLNQSDFGLLFPWLTKKIFGGDNPERVMRLNIRALLQFFRENGVSGVAKTGAKELVEGGVTLAENEDGIHDDKAILSNNGKGGSDVQAWVPINIVGLGVEAGPNERELVSGQVTTSKAEEAEQAEEAMEGEIEPSLVKHKEVKVASAEVVDDKEAKEASAVVDDKEVKVVLAGVVDDKEAKVASTAVTDGVKYKPASVETAVGAEAA